MADNNRIAFVDYIRVIACFLVMLVHSSENFYIVGDGHFSMLASETNRLSVSFYDGFFGRISVPLFMIISAFLLVPMKKDMTMTGFYKRRFKRIIPPLIIFMILYCFLPILWGGMTVEEGWQEFKMLPVTFPSPSGHLWFMFPLISLYLIIPVVSPWLEKATAREERIFIGLFVVSTFVPWLMRFASPDGGTLWGTCFWNPYFGMLYYCSGYLGYLVLAHYIRHHLNWKRSKRFNIGLLCFIAGGLFTAWSFYYVGVPGERVASPMLEWSWEFCTPNVLLATFGAFLMFTCIESKKAPRWITGIAKLSFGMYLMHMFFLSTISSLLVGDDPANPVLPVYVTIPCIAILTYLCCVITTKLISLIPGSKWLIG